MKNCKKYMAHYLFTLIVFILTITGCSESHGKKPKQKHFNEVGNYIEFQLGKENFKVDKRYFKGGAQNQLGVLQNANFWALLPDFKAYDKHRNRYEFIERLGWGNKIFFELYSSFSKRVSIAKIIERYKNKQGIKAFSHRLGFPDKNIYGLEVYYSNTYSDDEYLYRPNGKIKVYITCRSKKMNVPYPSCNMLWDPFDSVYAEASFSIAYLPKWQIINSKIQQIYNGQTL